MTSISRSIRALLLIVPLLAACSAGGPGADFAEDPADTMPDGLAVEPIDVATISQCDLGAPPAETDRDVAGAPIEFVVDGDVAVMTGNIGGDIVHRVCDLMRANPDLDLLEVADVPGASTEGNQTLDAGLALNAGGIATVVPSDGQVESGGVDLFLAGAERRVEDGACLGVHSTEIETDAGPVAAAELPRDDPEHAPFLAYFRAVGVPEDFYWFTLESAPPDGIHYLTPDEMERFRITTGPAPDVGCPLEDES